MICKNCNTENVDNAVFCSNCGAKMEEEAPKVVPTPVSIPVPQPVVPTVNKNKIPDEYKPLSPWGYIGLSILYCIPIVGFVFLMIHTFSRGNLNRRSYARSYWCAALIGLIIGVIFAAIILIAAASGVAVSEIASSYYY